MKPIIIVPKNTLAAADLTNLRENGVCVVEATDPAKVKFVDPIPASSSRTEIENTAIKFSRLVLAGKLTRFDWGDKLTSDFRAKLTALYVDLLVSGTPLDPEPSQQEIEKKIFDEAKRDELRQLAREEAKAERLALKAKKDMPESKPEGRQIGRGE